MLGQHENKQYRPVSIARILDLNAERGAHGWVLRLRSDFRLAMVSLFGFCAVLVIAPFAFYRFWVGDYLIGVADTLIVAAFVSIMVFSWRTDRADIGGTVTALVGSGAALAMLVFLELDHSWVFAALVANFLLARRGFAIGVSALLIASIGVVLYGTMTGIDLVTFVAVALLMSMFSLIFASRVDSQHRQLSELAVLDPLTGAGNRRALQVDLPALVATAQRSGEPCGVAVLDLDHFKQVNDEHGHEAGDQVLMDLARIVQETTRRSDHFYRFGGEEFVLLLPGTSREGMFMALENLLADVRRHLKGPTGAVSVSIGCAHLAPGENAMDWLARADRALYQAKKQGRDCLVADDTDTADISERRSANR